MRKIIGKLREFDFIHTAVLFGSRAKGTGDEDSDLDICVVLKPDKELTLEERISLENSLPKNVDMSLFSELPLNVRKRVFKEGEVLYTQDLYYFLTLGKETDLEYIRYKKFREDYHNSVMGRVARRLAYGH